MLSHEQKYNKEISISNLEQSAETSQPEALKPFKKSLMFKNRNRKILSQINLPVRAGTTRSLIEPK